MLRIGSIFLKKENINAALSIIVFPELSIKISIWIIQALFFRSLKYHKMSVLQQKNIFFFFKKLLLTEDRCQGIF